MCPGRVKSLIRDANDELRCRHGYTNAIPELNCGIGSTHGRLYTNSLEHETDFSLSRSNETSRVVSKRKMSRLVGTGHSYYCLSFTMYKFSQEDYADLYSARNAINFTQSGASLGKCPSLEARRQSWYHSYTFTVPLFPLYLVRVKYKCICFFCTIVHIILFVNTLLLAQTIPPQLCALYLHCTKFVLF
jgi:hypothetical protein